MTRVSAAGLLFAAACAHAGPDPSLVPGFDPMCGCGKCAAMSLPTDPRGPVYSPREASTDTDVQSVDLDLEVTFGATPLLKGSNTMRVRSTVNGLTQFTFMLRTNFTVQRNNSGNAADNNRVTLNGTTVATCTTPGANSYARTVTLDRAYNAGEEFTVRVDYSGEPASRGFGSIFVGTQNGVDLAASLSEPYYAATWWPVKDGDVFLPGNNADKFTGSIAITVPSALKGVANGLLTSVTNPAAGKTRYRWTTNYQTAPYLFAFSATNYNQWAVNYSYPLQGGGTGTMPVQFSIYPSSDTPGNRAAWEQTVQMLTTYRSFYGEYPFVNEKYGIYQFPFGGGMEHQTYTGQGTFSESVTAHELGHQWWGDNVTCKLWNDIWLNEGFATYTEALWYERKPGSTGQPALVSAMNARRPNAVDDSVYVYDVSNLNRIFSGTFTYNKGGWALHQLRHVMGDAAFFQALAQYRAAYQGSAAVTDDFVAVCSAVAGQDLTWFFRQWIYGIGAPQYQYGWTNATINGQPYLRLSVAQTQDSTWPGGGAPLGYFRMPVDVRITTAGGSTTSLVNNAARQQWFLIPVTQAVTGIALDPDTWILETGKTATTYTPGPVKVVSATPGPSAVLSSAPAQLEVGFSDQVLPGTSNFVLTGPGGPVSLTVSYNSTTFVATLTPAAPLAAGSYSLRVTGISTPGDGRVLDGEIVGTALPSGDGVPGGDALFAFTISGPVGCDPDVNQDGNVDQGDVDYLINVVGGGLNPTGVDPDFNQDGNSDQGDIDALVNVIAGGPCP